MKQYNLFLRIFVTAILLSCFIPSYALGKRETKTVDVGDTFTVYSSGHTNLQSVLWTWDTGCLELVGSLYGTSTSATFKAKKATPASGVIIQATVYYYASQGTIMTGKFFDDWTIHIEDKSTVSLSDTRKTLSPGSSFGLRASTSPSSYTGSYKWTTSNSSVAYVSGSGNSVTVRTVSSGRATIRVTLDNGKYDECVVVVEDNSTVSLDQTRKDLSTGGEFTLRANASSGYSGSYSWTSSNSSVASCSGSGSSATVSGRSSGHATITVSLSNGASARCEVYVTDVDVTSVSVSDIKVEVEKETTINMSVYPSNATVKTTTWNVVSGSDVISISSSGRITTKKPGTAVVNCLVNGSVRSNNATVTVTEPKLTKSAVSPEQDATGITAFVQPVITYSHQISKGTAFSSISLSSAGQRTDASVEIVGKELRILPAKPLKPLTRYTISVPRNAVMNKWGSSAQSDVSFSFTTADYEKAKVEIYPAGGSYITTADVITLKAVPADATIYYTLDGSNPSVSSTKYTGPFKLQSDVTVKAIAVREGYHDSDVATAKFFKSQSEVVAYYPNDDMPLFNYAPVSPFLKFGGSVLKSNNFRRISMTDGSGNDVAGEAYLTNYMVIFVPDEPLKNSTKYTVDIPTDAVKTSNGEVFKGFKWTFTTPTFPTQIGMRGDETVYVLGEDGSLRSRGMEYLSFTPGLGSFDFKDNKELTEIRTGITGIACGYTSSLFLDATGNDIYNSGMLLYGVPGVPGSIAAVGKIKLVRTGFQVSAIIGDDNSLWMWGRNDFYQLGDSTGTSMSDPVRIADNVIDVALGNGFTLYVDGDNVLWAVGRNHLGQLGDGSTTDRRIPVKIMDGVARVSASAGGYFSACITTGGKLMTWGDNALHQLGRKISGTYSASPGEVMDNVVSVSLGMAHALAVTDEAGLYVWGSSSNLQISDLTTPVTQPTPVASYVKEAVAGPHTTLILYINGKVTGSGCRSHNNFGDGDGNVRDFVIDEGREWYMLQNVSVEPGRFETTPGSSFALAAIPSPLSSDYELVEWSSDRPDVASVEGNGVIRTGGLGEATITARMVDRFGREKTASAIVVCTDNPDNSGVESVSAVAGDWSARTRNNTIIVENVTPGVTYTVYNMQGITIGSAKAETDILTFETGQIGVYIVRSENKSVKVICR